jgi:hypothetical protein
VGYHLDKLAPGSLRPARSPAGPGLRQRAAALAAGLLLVLVDLSIKLTQAFAAGRLGSAEDALVNLLGVALGLAARSPFAARGCRWAEPTRAASEY